MGTFLKLLYMEVLLATAASLLWGILGYQPHVQGTDLSYSCDLCNSLCRLSNVFCPPAHDQN